MAANEIRSQGFNLNELFRDVTYEIDYYQRDYTWGEEEVRVLLRDLCATFRVSLRASAFRRRPDSGPQYFLGPFVYHEPSARRRFLVDGQQRFVTLHLLFLQLRLSAREAGDTHTIDQLNRVITTDGKHFSVGISDHDPVLRSISEGRKYETGPGDSLSRRNLWARGRQIESQLSEELDAEELQPFTEWLLTRVVLVGIRAADSDHGYRMFETMNDRGARLTAVDLLKSHLLANVGAAEEQLNTQWQEMLRELSTDRDDPQAASRFIKAYLLARCAREGNDEDRRQITTNLNVWVRHNADHLGLTEGRRDRFLAFVQDMLRTARLYRPVLAATRTLKKDDRLETVLFNERNGLGVQCVAVLAAVDPDDRPTDAKDKGRLVASYIDRWYALRILQDLPVQSADAEALVHSELVPLLRNCRTVDEVASMLGSHAQQSGSPVRDAITLGLRGNNSHQIRYLLARATAYADEACKKPSDILAYLDGDQFHIEHLWANHHSLVVDEIPDPVVFRSRRNQLGGLGLLRGRENSSINDLPFHEKNHLYARNNVLLGVLAPAYDRRNPELRDFIRSHQLDRHMRAFGSKETLTAVVATRQELYLRLFERIWSPERLGFPVLATDELPADGSGAAPARPRPAPVRSGTSSRRRTDVAKMIDAKVLTAGTRIVLTYRATDHWATIDGNGGIVLTATGGTPYGRADEAGAVARGTKTCKGMNEWHVENENGDRVSLRALRDRAVAAGEL